MSRIHEHDGRKVKIPSHGVTDIKPAGLMAVRPTTNSTKKTKDGASPCSPQSKGGPASFLSSEMVRVIKSALLEATTNYCSQNDKKSNFAGKSRVQLKSAVHTKCTPQTARTCHKGGTASTGNGYAKKKVATSANKMELMSRMNMEGVDGPRCASAMELYRRHSESDHLVKPLQKKVESRGPPSKRERDSSRRKSLISVPTSSPDRRNSHTSGVKPNQPRTASKNSQPPGGLEYRNLQTMSLDRFVLNRPKPRDHIKPDMTMCELLKKFVSYCNAAGFRDTRYERRTAKTPALDTIPEES